MEMEELGKEITKSYRSYVVSIVNLAITIDVMLKKLWRNIKVTC